MYCCKCGKQNPDTSRFCSGCGARLDETPVIPAQPSSTTPAGHYPQYPGVPQEDFIDLTKVKNFDKPQEGKHWGTVLCALILAVAWGVFTFLFGQFLDSTGVDLDDDMLQVLFPVAFICLPVSLVGLLVVNMRKKAAGEMRELPKSYSLVFLMMSTLISSLCVANGLSQIAGGASSLGEFLTLFLLVPMIIGYVVLVNISANENGAEGTFGVLRAFFISFIPAILLGYLLMRLFMVAIIVIAVGFFAMTSFFGNGGMIISRRNYE